MPTAPAHCQPAPRSNARMASFFRALLADRCASPIELAAAERLWAASNGQDGSERVADGPRAAATKAEVTKRPWPSIAAASSKAALARALPPMEVTLSCCAGSGSVHTACAQASAHESGMTTGAASARLACPATRVSASGNSSLVDAAAAPTWAHRRSARATCACAAKSSHTAGSTGAGKLSTRRSAGTKRPPRPVSISATRANSGCSATTTASTARASSSTGQQSASSATCRRSPTVVSASCVTLGRAGKDACSVKAATTSPRRPRRPGSPSVNL